VDNDAIGADLERAGHLIDIGRYERARGLLAGVLASAPEDLTALDLLAEALWMEDRDDEAAAVARQMVALHPDRVEGPLMLARVLEHQDQPEEAEPYARRAVELAPHGAAAHRVLGRVLAQLPGGAETAREVLTQAVALAPDEPLGYYDLGTALVNLREWVAAENVVLEGLRRSPDSAACLMRLGVIRLKLQRYDEAIDDIMRGIAQDPEVHDLAAVAHLIEVFGVPARLASLYTSVCAALGWPDLTQPGIAGSDPELRQLQLDAADRLCLSMEEELIEPASEARLRAIVAATLAEDPAHGPARRLSARLMLRDKDHAGALALASSLLAEGYDDAEVYRTVVVSCEELERLDEALAFAQRGTARHPDDDALLWEEGYLLLETGRLDAGLAVARRAIEIGSYHVWADYLLGRALVETGELAEAEPVLRRALRHDPDDAETNYWLAHLLHDSGRDTEARTHARRVAGGTLESATERRRFPALASTLGLPLEESAATGGRRASPS
jgi:tetratricopeptide (TPR) repeat protein